MYFISNARDEYDRENDIDWNVLLKQLNYPKNKKILDFGCGIGSVGLQLIHSNEMYFYDINTVSIDFLEWRIKKRNKHAVIVNNLNDFEDLEKFDIIIAWGVFEHFNDESASNMFNYLLSRLNEHGIIYMKNFYHVKDKYLKHYDKGEKMTKLFEDNSNRILFYKEKAVLLFSGGLDSTVILEKLIRNNIDVIPVYVDFEEKHTKFEMIKANEIAEYYKIPLMVIKYNAFTISNMKDWCQEHPEDYLEYLPMRSLLMILIAINYANSNDIYKIYFGVTKDDHCSPDCYTNLFKKLNEVVDMATPKTGKHTKIVLPLENMTKIDIVRKAIEYEIPENFTYSCIRGEENPCGECFSCKPVKDAYKTIKGEK